MKKNNSKSSKDIIPKLERPKGEGLLRNLPELEEPVIMFGKYKCEGIVLLHIEGEIFQSIIIPVELISKLPNHNNKIISHSFTKRLMITGLNGELIEKEGVYVFFHTNESNMTKKIYIGQSNTLITRLKKHSEEKKSSFTSVLIITSSLNNIGIEKLKVLESKLIIELEKNHNYDVINKQKHTNFYVDVLEEDLMQKYLKIILNLIKEAISP